MQLKYGDFIANKYKIEEEIGCGSFGRVYQALNVQLGRSVAIKVLERSDPSIGSFAFQDYSDRFRREAKIQAMYNHPHIVHIYDLIEREKQQQLFLVMELVSGSSLRERLQIKKQLPVDEAIRLTIELLIALDIVHDGSRDVVHRDIKPSNILLTAGERPRVKLSDFGLAQLGDESIRSNGTGKNHPGTPLYMSPEQEKTAGYLDPASDLFSVGCVLFEMLTGQMYKRVWKKPRRLRTAWVTVPESLQPILERVLAKEADDRYGEAYELIEVLRDVECSRNYLQKRRRQDQWIAEAEEKLMIEEWEAVLEIVGRLFALDAKDADGVRLREAVIVGQKAAAKRADTELQAQLHATAQRLTRTSRVICNVEQVIAAREWNTALIELNQLEILNPPPLQTQLKEVSLIHNVKLPYIVTGKPPLEFQWCWVPGGEFTMGSENGCYDEKPVHQVEVDDFWIARYPVVNAQYACFIDDKGYEESKWWTEAGWTWRETQVKMQPKYWEDEEWNGHQRPVVGITWHEARAFCAWASEKSEQRILLPTEAQWEKAARSTDGRTYPWGEEEPTKEYCNFYHHVRQTTDVGYYSPIGDSVFGCADMAGNVWEWVRDTHKIYSYQADNGHNNLDNLGKGIVRGGSWNDLGSYLRASFRNDVGLSNASYYIGFRCVQEPST